MKRFILALVAAFALAGPFRPAWAADVAYNADLINDASLALDTNFDMDLKEISTLSFVAVYSTQTASQKTFDDGRKSTATITLSSASAVVGRTIWVGGVRFLEGTDWTADVPPTASGMAKALSDAIENSAALADVCNSSWTAAGIIFTTSTVPSGTAYSLATSTPAAARLNGSSTAVVASSLNGADPKVEISSDKVRVEAHGYGTGFGVWLQVVSGTAPTGLTNGTTYYVIKTNNAQLQLATSKTTAGAGTAIDITALTGGGSFRFNPVVMSGTPSFKWQSSNDGVSFSDVSVSSVTVTVAGVSSWDFGVLPYRYLRLKYTSPTFGAISLQASGNGDR